MDPLPNDYLDRVIFLNEIDWSKEDEREEPDEDIPDEQEWDSCPDINIEN